MVIYRWSVYYMEYIQLTFLFYTFFSIRSLFYCSAKDTVSPTIVIRDEKRATLVSAGERFELGFFSPAPPGSSDKRRYIGIWYHKSDPIQVVWVANREKPLHDRNGFLAIEDGNLKIQDATGDSYWSTTLEKSSSTNQVVKLKDSGNLVLSDDQLGMILWQSFDHPTDTFLPGMKMDTNLTLTSWKGPDDPANGNFTFKIYQEENPFFIPKGSVGYWVTGGSGKFFSSYEISLAIVYFLSNFTQTVPTRNSSTFGNVSILSPPDFSNKRLVMNFTGEIDYWNWNDESGSSLIWASPEDACSVVHACGNFGSCNPNSYDMCKCLPGFVPSSTEKWESADFSGGCTRKSTSCDQSDTFLSLKMMKVGRTDKSYSAENETECRKECLNNCQCQAYSYDSAEANSKRVGYSTGTGMCWIWTEDLTDLQEEYTNGGHNLSVRVAISDIEPTARNCETCGTNMIPYPLSTGPNCGDPMYFSFQCNPSTGQLYFKASSGMYYVSSINPDMRKFVIQAKSIDNCNARNSEGIIQSLNQSLPFTVTNSWCNAGSSNISSTMLQKSKGEIEIGWEPPPEPTCTSSKDCKDWPFSTCNATENGKGRCHCNTNFEWNAKILNCTSPSLVEGGQERQLNRPSRRNVQWSVIIVVTISSAIALSCAAVFIYVRRRNVKRRENMEIQRNQALRLYDTERYAKDLRDTGEFKEEDKKGIDVPFFDFESILAATDNFSNANKLGQGGYGPVYKGKFPGGQEIAVKRLSSFSGQGLQEFKNEIVLIAKLQHRNLVRLWGYCVEGDEKILLYEYMPNRSLDAFIFDSKLSSSLDWDMRFNIILGIARGLLYLHQDSRLRIIHRDMKTSNILLDEEMNPKISDFGLARIVGGKQNEANTNRVVGTYGYMSPEYALDGIFSVKSDVFSFGVVLLEIISGKRNKGSYQSEHALNLLGDAWGLWKEDNVLDLMDQTLHQTCNRSEFMRSVNVGLLCVQEDPNDRPTMSGVVVMLGSETATLPTPKQPAFVVRRDLSSTASSSSKTEANPSLMFTFEESR